MKINIGKRYSLVELLETFLEAISTDKYLFYPFSFLSAWNTDSRAGVATVIWPLGGNLRMKYNFLQIQALRWWIRCHPCSQGTRFYGQDRYIHTFVIWYGKNSNKHLCVAQSTINNRGHSAGKASWIWYNRFKLVTKTRGHTTFPTQPMIRPSLYWWPTSVLLGTF